MTLSRSPKDLVVMLTGIILFALGVWFGIPAYTRIFGAGLLLVGVGTIALGATEGFIDSSPVTARVSKLGMFAYGIGIPALIYGVWHLN